MHSGSAPGLTGRSRGMMAWTCSLPIQPQRSGVARVSETRNRFRQAHVSAITLKALPPCDPPE